MKILLLVVMFVCLTMPALAVDGAYAWRILFKNGESVTNARLNSLQNDTLYFSLARNYSDFVALDSIVHISRKKGDAALPGTLIGAVAGGIAGFAVKPETRNDGETQIYSTLFGLVVGGGIGFLAGSRFESEEYYDLSVTDPASKRKLLQKILE